MKVLITNRTLDAPNGAATYVRDLALELLAQGHRPMVYTAELGAVAKGLKNLTVPVIDNLDEVGARPDIIHGQHFMTTMAALTYFDDVPVVNVSHGWRPWSETPVRHPNVMRYVAVDEAVRDRLALQHGIPDERISIGHNFVNLDRFQPAAQPQDHPDRILLFNSYVSERSPYVIEAQKAAAQLNVHLDVVGTTFGNETANPEQLLGEYDVVLAQGRSALEALAVGASVVICSSRAFGPLVRPDNVNRLRELNFGIRTHTLPVAADTITSQLSEYNPADAAKVSAWIRERVGVGDAARELVEIYTAAIDEFDSGAVDRREAARATGRFLTQATVEFHDTLHRYYAARPQARADAQGVKLQRRAEGERNDLREQLRVARSELAAERRTVKQLRRRVEAQQRRLDDLMGSRMIHAQGRVRASPLLAKSYRALTSALGRR